MKLFIVVCLLFGFVKGHQDDFKILDSIIQEENCLGYGGICTIAEDCPRGQLVKERGLCPSQRSRGVECCYGLSVKETRCGKRGGQCISIYQACAQNLVFRNATDCPSRSKCCVNVTFV